MAFALGTFMVVVLQGRLMVKDRNESGIEQSVFKRLLPDLAGNFAALS